MQRKSYRQQLKEVIEAQLKWAHPEWTDEHAPDALAEAAFRKCTE